MNQYPVSIQKVIKWFSRLPGIGYKSAERMVTKLLEMSSDEIDSFAGAMIEMKQNIRNCSECNAISDHKICAVCADSSRDRTIVCLVEQAKDMFAIERGGGYNGLYFVLGGKLSPLNGIGPDQLAFSMLETFIDNNNFTEIILATGSDVEGEATSVYTQRLLKSKDIKISRIAYGVPVGSSIDFADEMTLLRAIEGRRQY
ncbi:recombination protein RecR [bacterium]|nr:recombination protein RecR [bacterium]